MEEPILYQQIAASIRHQILTGEYKPGDRLPSVRALCTAWNCTPGTIQRAYAELAREGLLVSRAGRGTQVAGPISQAKTLAQATLRRANLVNRSETFLLEALTAGYDLNDVQQAMDLAMDRWRTLDQVAPQPPAGALRFCGSHDLLINDLAHQFFGGRKPGLALQLSYAGSLGGLIALVEGRADLAGSHLWDAESDTYNLPFVRRLLPGQETLLVTLAHRRQGLILANGNPLRLAGLADLTRPGVRFVNRQPGSGTRVWLDAHLTRLGLAPSGINGYADERLTHSDVARAVAEGNADVGIGLEMAALAYGLDFVFLNLERYDLIVLAESPQMALIRPLLDWLASPAGRRFVEQHPGYDARETGQVRVSAG